MDLSNGETAMQAGPLDVSTEQLEKMFHKNMNLYDRLAKASSHQNPPAAVLEEIEEKPKPFKYSISQHYTHTCTYCLEHLFLIGIEWSRKGWCQHWALFHSCPYKPIYS